MSTPITAAAGGFFVQLMPLLTDRTLMVIVSKSDDQHLTLSVVPKRMKEGEDAAMTMPLCCTGTAVAREELNKKRKSAGNGVAKNKTPEVKPPDEEKAPPQPSMISLFDSPAEVPPVEQSSPAVPDREGSIVTPSGSSTGGER
jgi:hypothetical protein